MERLVTFKPPGGARFADATGLLNRPGEREGGFEKLSLTTRFGKCQPKLKWALLGETVLPKAHNSPKKLNRSSTLSSRNG